MKRAQVSLAIAAILCGALSLFGWWSNAAAFAAAPFQDWAVFYAAGSGYLDFASWQSIFAHWPLHGHPWLYPPSFLLLLLPFARLSFGLGCAAFLSVTLFAFLFVLWRGAGSWRALHALAVILSPAAMINFYLGQNAFLSSALLGGGAMALKRRPVLAGILIGLMIYKPQLALLAPVALIASRSWKALGSAAAAALVLVLCSASVFGAEAWRSWLAMATGAGDRAPAALAGRLAGASVFTCATLFGAAPLLANGLQALAIAIGAAAVYVSWRNSMRAELRLAVLLAATVFAAPHVAGYDAMLLAFAGSLLFADGIEYGCRPGERIIALLVWTWPLVTPPVLHPAGRLTPVIVGLFIAAVMVRGLLRPERAPAPAPLVTASVES